MELLLDIASLCIPDYGRVVHATAKQSVFQLSVTRPDARLTIIRPRSKQGSVAVPVQGRNVLALFLLVLLISIEVFERYLLGTANAKTAQRHRKGGHTGKDQAERSANNPAKLTNEAF
eukprot:5050409-Pyramimonas_sp.AAC.2